jgi:hypothetical protein
MATGHTDYQGETIMELSARNQLRGTVKSVTLET